MTQLMPATRDAKRLALAPLLLATSLSLLMLTAWELTHRYGGLARDAQLYALQAAARLNPSLGLDVYLANTSQDQFTVFSRLYALLIEPLGLQSAEFLLFILCTVGFLAAAWALAKVLSDNDCAWLSVGTLIVTAGTYGAYGIFSYSENYLTARSLAEAMIVTACAVYFHGRKALGVGVAVSAMFVHPLMALPGVLLLTCLSISIRKALWGALLGIVATLGIALLAVMAPAQASFITVIDPSWLEVVRERSQHLFLQYWTASDGEALIRPFLCLTLTAMVINDKRARSLCAAALLVGASGLAVAWIAGTIGPVAVLLQGQAWRWMWVTTFVSVLLLATTVMHLWRDAKCGVICAVLLLSGWIFPPVHGAAMVALALIFWALRPHIDERISSYLRWAGFALILIMVAWMTANCWSVLTSTSVMSTGAAAPVDRLRSIFGLQIATVLFIGGLFYWIRRNRSLRLLACITVLLVVSSTSLMPSSFEPPLEDSRAQIARFAEWRDVIPPSANVLIVPAPISASFVWFTLQRPNYYSLSQSAGVVFARATAFEIRRRSEVLLPIMEPDWKIYSQIARKAHGEKLENLTRPLTAKRLVEICSESQLGFVIAKEHFDFDPLRHRQAGAWKDWNLYDCRRVRSAAPTA
jgi:hypothetical protein